MKKIPRTVITANLTLTGVLTLIAFAVIASRSNPVAAVFISIAIGCLFFIVLMEKYVRRFFRLRTPFPDDWREILQSRVSFYRRLDQKGRIRFEQDVSIFLDQQHIYGVQGRHVSEEIRLLIAASAATLGFGMPDWEWPDLRDILVFPTGFNEEYQVRDDLPIKGMVHQQGPIIFSEDELRMGYLRSSQDSNVGLHEMAHVLDMANGSADGIPVGLNWVASAPWIRIMADRIQKVRKGKCREVLRDYAGVDEAEFFAVAVEVFFQRPTHLKKADPELFSLLKDYFKIDPENPGDAA
ncbi:zinc-dependent peptidase [bacterium]|nr:zinc-dependent peptidase [candidate division CSSED10-310 bacterium]